MTRLARLAALASLLSCATDPALAADALPPEQCFATPSCRADSDGNGAITTTDFARFLNAYQKSWAATCLADPVCRFDFDGNGVVTVSDFGALFSASETD